MGTNLYEASNQWATRPADERFASLEDLHAATKRYADGAIEAEVNYENVELAVGGGDTAPLLVSKASGTAARFTHYAFGQFARTLSAPAEYVRALSPQLVCDVLNYGLKKMGDRSSYALMHSNGSLLARCFVSRKYSRIWNHEVVARLMDLGGRWRVPPARPAMEGQPGTRVATEADVLAMSQNGGRYAPSVRVGDLVAPAGLYASDHDMFVFMVNDERRLCDGRLSRGFFLTNSEVGDGALVLKRFLLDHVCGNHICWNVSNVEEIRVIHTGLADQRFVAELRRGLNDYSESGAEADEAAIAKAKVVRIADTKEEVLDMLFGKKVATRKVLEAAYKTCEDNTEQLGYGDPRTAWGMMSGMTQYSQTIPFADERAEIDKAAGKVLQMVF